MTRQIEDTIEYNGKTFYFSSDIFSKYLQSIDKDIKFRMVSTANYSGTYESYVIQDGKLYLKHFFGFIEGDLPRKNFLDLESECKDYNIDKSYFFTEEKIIDDLIFADWFCGVIEIQEDPYPPYGESYFIIVDYGEIIEMHKFNGRMIEGANYNAPIYDYPKFDEPSENDDDLYKYEYRIISKLSDYDYILEDKSKEDLLLLGRFFDYYKKSLEGKSYHEKRDIFSNELEKLKEI